MKTKSLSLLAVMLITTFASATGKCGSNEFCFAASFPRTSPIHKSHQM